MAETEAPIIKKKKKTPAPKTKIAIKTEKPFSDALRTCLENLEQLSYEECVILLRRAIWKRKSLQSKIKPETALFDILSKESGFTVKRCVWDPAKKSKIIKEARGEGFSLKNDEEEPKGYNPELCVEYPDGKIAFYIEVDECFHGAKAQYPVIDEYARMITVMKDLPRFVKAERIVFLRVGIVNHRLRPKDYEMLERIPKLLNRYKIGPDLPSLSLVYVNYKEESRHVAYTRKMGCWYEKISLNKECKELVGFISLEDAISLTGAVFVERPFLSEVETRSTTTTTETAIVVK